MSATGLKSTQEGTFEDFLGVQFEKKNNGTMYIKQPHLIQSILKELNLNAENVTEKNKRTCLQVK